MTGVASAYGQALYELARDEGIADGIGEELRLLREILLQNPDFVRLVSSPSLSRTERIGVIDESFSGRAHPYVLSFMKILVERGHMRDFVDCCRVYRESYSTDHGILTVKTTAALPLNDAQSARLRRRISEITGKQIELISIVDPACLGGVRLDYDGKRVDGTVAGRLERLRGALKNALL